MPRNKNKLRNHLRITRKRLGFGQKHVARLLNHKTTDQVSRYEKGYRIPGLKLLLQFEIIYGLPARILYPDYFEELRAKIEERVGAISAVNQAYIVSSGTAGLVSEFCCHEELLRNPNPSQPERDQVRKHVVILMRRLNDLQV